MKNNFKRNASLIIPVLLGIFVLWIPLVRDFHVESALLVSIVGCFWAGWKACESPEAWKTDVDSAFLVLGHLYLFGLPLLVFNLMTGCFSVHGLGFWLLYPIPSVFFGYAIGRLLRLWTVPYRRLWTVGILSLIAIGAFLVEFFTFPQVYFFNHVWGGWPGPIYDETVQLSGSLLFFRFLTTGWIVLLWFIPDFHNEREAKWIVGLSALALILGYTQLSEMGVISPRSHLQSHLGGHIETEHFQLYFDKDHYTENEIRLIGRKHEFYLEQITRQLELDKPSPTHKIESYLYAHPWQKKKLVGAKFTSYVPVWLEQDQLHIAKQQLDSSLKHELVHVLAKQFGNDLFNASWSIGLIEGLAVAVAPDESSTSTIDQIVVSEKPYPSAGDMKHSLSPLGFYGGRSAVNYTTSGSFVRYLLNSYPVEDFKEAYRTGDLSSYPVSMRELAAGWYQKLDKVKVDSLDEKVARRLFSIRSLLEQKCPHIMSGFSQNWDRYRHYLQDHDTTKAIKSLDKALTLAENNAFVKAEWAFQHLKAGDIENVRQAASTRDSSIDLQFLYADAFALSNERMQAKKYVNEAKRRMAENTDPDSGFTAALATRTDSLQWEYYLKMTYQDSLFKPKILQDLYHRTQVRTLEKAIDEERWDLLKNYAQMLVPEPLNKEYFNSYIILIRYLGFLKEFDLANTWMEKVKGLELRERYRERLNQEKKWTRYLKGKE